MFSAATYKSFVLSILLHACLTGLLVVSLDSQTAVMVKPRPHQDVVKAVAVDNQAVEQELQRLKQIEEDKARQQQEAEQKLKAMEKQIADAEKKRRNEEQKLAETKKRQEEEKKKREAEEQRVAQLQKEKDALEKQRKEEEEKKRIAEQERKQEEERKRAAEEERKRQLAEEQKRKQAEQALKQQLAEEQAAKDRQLQQNIYSELYRRVKSNFNISGLPDGLKCVINVRVIPGGEIINATIFQSSGNDIFDNRALVAVQKASPLPMPQDAATLDRLRLRNFQFEFAP